MESVDSSPVKAFNPQPHHPIRAGKHLAKELTLHKHASLLLDLISADSWERRRLLVGVGGSERSTDVLGQEGLFSDLARYSVRHPLDFVQSFGSGSVAVHLW